MRTIHIDRDLAEQIRIEEEMYHAWDEDGVREALAGMPGEEFPSVEQMFSNAGIEDPFRGVVLS